jgi:hypothetical protein
MSNQMYQRYIKDLEQGIIIAEKMAAVLAELEVNGVLDSPEILVEWHAWHGIEATPTANISVSLTVGVPSIRFTLEEKTSVLLTDDLFLESKTRELDAGTYIVQRDYDSADFDIIKVN